MIWKWLPAFPILDGFVRREFVAAVAAADTAGVDTAAVSVGVACAAFDAHRCWWQHYRCAAVPAADCWPRPLAAESLAAGSVS